MSDRLRLPGPRDVRATVDRPDARRVLVACPPHPQHGGDRRDSRLQAISDALSAHDVACLRFDYGPWDEGEGEQTDARNALAWADDNFETVGLFGYSFGGAVALRSAADSFDAGEDSTPDALSVLSPAQRLAGEATASAVDSIDCPLQVVYGERDDTVDSRPVADRARERGHTVETVQADHFFVGQQEHIGKLAASFLSERL